MFDFIRLSTFRLLVASNDHSIDNRRSPMHSRMDEIARVVKLNQSKILQLRTVLLTTDVRRLPLILERALGVNCCLPAYTKSFGYVYTKLDALLVISKLLMYSLQI